MNTTIDPLFTGLRDHLEAKALKYHCSVEIFCPLCNAILDCRCAVEVDIVSLSDEKLLRTAISCDKCYEKKAKKALEELAAKDQFKSLFELRIQDGREFHKRGLL